jgi:carbamoyl-phosphate synthase large subunit
MNRSILIFGAAKLQRSLIEQANDMGLFTVGIDPDENAECKDILNVFEVVGGNDFEKTIEIAQKYNISGIITTATDKPLIMMARVAEFLHLPFFSVQTAINSTDKLLMKNVFMKNKIPCAKGVIVENLDEIVNVNFPVIVKPRDNCGSRGVIYCKDKNEVATAINEAMSFTKNKNVLVEEYIEGKEYSIESLHFQNETKIIQFTEKITTDLPYNVELGHNQPANLTDFEKLQIQELIVNIANAMNFVNCASHTELKINENGIIIIETSPRLGGDFITSHLVPLSTGINIEEALLQIAIGEKPVLNAALEKSAIVRFLNFERGTIGQLKLPKNPEEHWDLEYFSFNLKVGDKIPSIKNSLDRYGEVIFYGETINDTFCKHNYFLEDFLTKVKIDL